MARLRFPAAELARHRRILLHVDGSRIPRTVAQVGVAIVWVSPSVDALLHDVLCRLQARRVFAFVVLRLGECLDRPAANLDVKTTGLRQLVDLRLQVCRGGRGCSCRGGGGDGSGGDGSGGGRGSCHIFSPVTIGQRCIWGRRRRRRRIHAWLYDVFSHFDVDQQGDAFWLHGQQRTSRIQRARLLSGGDLDHLSNVPVKPSLAQGNVHGVNRSLDLFFGVAMRPEEEGRVLKDRGCCWRLRACCRLRGSCGGCWRRDLFLATPDCSLIKAVVSFVAVEQCQRLEDSRLRALQPADRLLLGGRHRKASAAVVCVVEARFGAFKLRQAARKVWLIRDVASLDDCVRDFVKTVKIVWALKIAVRLDQRCRSCRGGRRGSCGRRCSGRWCGGCC